MGKESKEILRKILSNQKLIMAHLKIKESAPETTMNLKSAPEKAPAKKTAVKKHKK
ncbi:MAG: hypothetical protein PSX36_00360 [bacterium]|nr:hypothetical protein [bacterium]